MYYNTSQVIDLARVLHQGHKLKNGKNYFGHLVRVAEIAVEIFDKVMGEEGRLPSNFFKLREMVTQTAYLHDAVEDRTSLDQLYTMSIDPAVVGAVWLLSKKPGQSYEDYLREIKKGLIARVVKMADLCHNSRLTRIPTDETTEKIEQRHQKYLRSFLYLRNPEQETY